MADDTTAPFPLPRVTIKFCTQCKWMLRAAYYAQELLSTFSTSLGEVALQPSTGGTFVVEIFSAAQTATNSPPASLSSRILWDRKIDGGFPETKELKRRVRDVIEPGRDLGHVDRDHHGGKKAEGALTTAAPATLTGTVPSRAELEAAGQAGAGYPGADKAAIQMVEDAKEKQQQGVGREACESKEACEDCD